MKIVVAITAASGQIYASQVVELLASDPNVERVAVIYSSSATEVAAYEGISLAASDKVTTYSHDNMFAPMASGSASWDAMIVVPCSVGTMSRLASGISDSLIARAADVMLKERRKLILVVRESPLSLIHLRNMTTLTEAGAIIMPASPTFYSGECDMQSITMSVSRRVVSLVGAVGGVQEWDGKKNG